MAKQRPRSPEATASASLTYTGKQKRRPDLDPVTEKILGGGRKANAAPSGGGGGAWKDPTIYKRKEQAERKAGRKMTLQEFRESEFWTPPPADNFSKDGRAMRDQTASLKGGATWNMTTQPYDGGDPQTVASSTGTSIFDPVLCELAYRWFCPPGGRVLDPFAGGSVRGIVAAKLGRHYLGVDLSKRQIEANRSQAKAICDSAMPKWIVGDSMEIAKLCKGFEADFVFSCPPYCDLEVYSDDPRDLSTMTHENYVHCYERIVSLACERLVENRFACFVVGDARNDKGKYYGLPWKTVAAFHKAGLELYNEAVLVTAAGSLPVRASKQFEVSRKLGKTHQNCLIFVKGDPVKATEAIGDVEFGEFNPVGEGAPEAISLGGGEV